MHDAVGILCRLLECGAVVHQRRVENNEIGIGAHLNSAFAFHATIDAFEPACRQQRHFPHTIHERDHMALADEAAEDACVRARAPWMTDRLAILKLESAVTRHHDVRIAIRLVGGALGNHEDHREAALLSVALEAFRR